MKNEAAKVVVIDEDLVLVDKSEFLPERLPIFDDNMDTDVVTSKVLIGRGMNFVMVIKPDLIMSDGYPHVAVINHEPMPTERAKAWNRLVINIIKAKIDSSYFLHTLEKRHFKMGDELTASELKVAKEVVTDLMARYHDYLTQ